MSGVLCSKWILFVTAIIAVNLMFVNSNISETETSFDDELKSTFSLKERFQRLLALDEQPHNREKRLIYFQFKFPFASNMEIKWTFNWVAMTEAKYTTKLQVALPLWRPLPAYLTEEINQPPFQALFGTKLGREGAGGENENEVYNNYDWETEDHTNRNPDTAVTKADEANKTEIHNVTKRSPATSHRNKRQDELVHENTPDTETPNGSGRVSEFETKIVSDDITESEREQETVFDSYEEHSEHVKSLHVMHRLDAYNAIERILTKYGYPGHACLLRTVCEVAEAPLHYGIMGDFFNLLLTPSVASLSSPSSDMEFLKDYLVAEEVGRDSGDCRRSYADCPSSVFEIIPLVSHKVLDFGLF
ncbi:uncharacterized protein LOC108675711 [Hyalella azteca]|uniref:Uncharacterized protein LOC108675711 n=1 Tax=Hyalella azteca TaxID=294128 RepID=A0A8B7NZH4_HYAAZ|nr:uncharacterized protein LOC108675711 [Hyalella azteca]